MVWCRSDAVVPDRNMEMAIIPIPLSCFSTCESVYFFEETQGREGTDEDV